MVNEADIKSEYKTLEEEAESIVIVDYKLIGFEYGAPVAVSCLSNYRDRLLMAAACCCCCGLAAVKCSNDVNSKLRVGDMEGARKASDKALCFTNTAVMTGL
ncbi:uncharacterized protein LOC135351509 [Halichondria panicea]|uniref:uncharacterized protein LOC135351509 n=1 Tax=Halichondria panicea TaxID=6063 RepID=UPI00312B3F32